MGQPRRPFAAERCRSLRASRGEGGVIKKGALRAVQRARLWGGQRRNSKELLRVAAATSRVDAIGILVTNRLGDRGGGRSALASDLSLDIASVHSIGVCRRFLSAAARKLFVHATSSSSSDGSSSVKKDAVGDGEDEDECDAHYRSSEDSLHCGRQHSATATAGARRRASRRATGWAGDRRRC